MPQPGWFNQNAQRAYPFVAGVVGLEEASLSDAATIPKEAIVDCGIWIGPTIAYDPTSHVVYLAEVRRESDVLYFEFASDAPDLYGETLVFSREIDAARNQTEFLPIASESDSDACNEPPRLSGFLTTGDLTSLLEFLPGDGTLWGSTELQLEPGTVHSLQGHFVTQLNIANKDRTRVVNQGECSDLEWSWETEEILVDSYCLQGHIRFQEGYSGAIYQDPSESRLEFSAEPGGGEGFPCEDVPLFEGESAPDDRSTLDGAWRCNEVLRSINGIGGRSLPLSAGDGIFVSTDPDNHTVSILIDPTGEYGESV